jgi:Insertion element 4 transposase N-terminal
VVYYVIMLALFMNSSCKEVLRCLMEGLQWLSVRIPMMPPRYSEMKPPGIPI